MGWQTHFSYSFTISGPFGKPSSLEQSIDVKQEIPMDQLFASRFTCDTRELSLNHRKILWAYEHVPKSVWARAARELAQQIQEHPSSGLTITTSRAGVAVVLTMLADAKLMSSKQLHFQFQDAPLQWLEKRFAPLKAKHSVEHAPSLIWPTAPRRAA